MTKTQPIMLAKVVFLGRGHAEQSQNGALSEFVKEILPAESPEAALELINRHQPDLAIIDGSIPPAQALSFLDRLKHTAPGTPAVVVAEQPSVDLAVKFIRAGALDYVAGPLDRQHLATLLAGMTEEAARASGAESRFFCSACPPGLQIVGKSDAMVKTLETIRIVAESRCNPVLILGETGTGKELAARAVHAWRCGDPAKFVAVNCAALTASLLESELFGHVKGAFTGADGEKTGLFELAGDGTIFLDEISEMPSNLQAKLLRVLQERSFRKVGGTKDICCSATVIASSNRQLMTDIKEGKFRQDLYYRLAVFPIKLPTLRSPQRRDDIELLAEYFIENSSVVTGGPRRRLSKTARQRLRAHDWPGNVRELRNVVDRALILSQSELMTQEQLLIETSESPPAQQSPASSQGANSGDGSEFSLATAEREFILRALQETGWQRTRAAALLGITRATLHAKLNRYGIKPPGMDTAIRADGPLKVQKSHSH